MAGGSPPNPHLDVSIVEVLSIKSSHLQNLRQDPELKMLQHFILTGWPDSMQDLPKEFHPYWSFRDELSILDGLTLKSNRVIIPLSMRPRTLQQLYDAHQGLSSTLHCAC